MLEQDSLPRIAYCNPFVPVEWIAAHRCHPRWLQVRGAGGPSPVSGRRGVCPLAAGVANAVASGVEADAVVLTTACDQMRYAAAWLEQQARRPLFVMHVPSTWQTTAAHELFLEELQRLGRFLVQRGGQSPSGPELAEVLVQFDAARTALRQARRWLPAREFTAALLAVREDAQAAVPRERGLGESSESRAANGGVPLAIVGGPLVAQDYVPPLEALARMALADPMVGSPMDRAERVCRDARAFGAEAVVISRIPGASHCGLEGLLIGDVVRRRLDVPVVEIEVPPLTDSLEPGLCTRLEALVETVMELRQR